MMTGMNLSVEWKNRLEFYEIDKQAKLEMQRTIGNYFEIFKALPPAGFKIKSNHLVETMIIEDIILSENDIEVFLVPEGNKPKNQ